MNYPLISSGQVQAAAGLAEAVADRYGCVGVISRAPFGTAALLDQTAQELSGRRIRCIRVQGPAAGGLASRGLIAQIVARPDPLTDADLEAGFKTLTEPGEGFRRVALLVSEAHSLLPSALRYVQLARQASPAKLCVVLAGKPGLAAALEGEDFVPLRSAMHMMELSEPAGAGLFDKASASPEPPAPRAGNGSPLVRLGLAAAIIPIVGLIWWRHLPAVPPQDAPSVPVSINPPSTPPAVSPPAAPLPAVALAERAGEPAPPEPDPLASPQAVAGPAADPAPPVAAITVPEPSASEAPAKPEAPAEQSADAAEPPAAEPPTSEPAAAIAKPPAPAADPPAVAATAELPAAPPERGEAPAPETVLADPASKPAAPAPDAGPPEPAIIAKPQQPHGTLTVTTMPPAQAGARRAPPAAVPQAAALPSRPAEDQPSLADEKRCRTIVFRAQLGKDPSDADKQFLRNGCRGG